MSCGSRDQCRRGRPAITPRRMISRREQGPTTTTMETHRCLPSGCAARSDTRPMDRRTAASERQAGVRAHPDDTPAPDEEEASAGQVIGCRVALASVEKQHWQAAPSRPIRRRCGRFRHGRVAEAPLRATVTLMPPLALVVRLRRLSAPKRMLETTKWKRNITRASASSRRDNADAARREAVRRPLTT